MIKQVNIKGMSRKEQDETLREVKILSALDHPFIVKYYDSFVDTQDFSLNIVMEYAPNGTLHDMLKVR